MFKTFWGGVVFSEALVAVLVLILYFGGRYLGMTDYNAGNMAFVSAAGAVAILAAAFSAKIFLAAILVAFASAFAVVAIVVSGCLSVAIGSLFLVIAAFVAGFIYLFVDPPLSRFKVGMSYLAEALVIGLPIYFSVA